MLVYSQTIQSFILKLTSFAKDILNQEMRLDFKSKRLHFNNYSYPLHFVVFEDPQKLGFFNPALYQVGINKRFLFSFNEELLKNLLRHELAHLYCHLKYGETVDAHGKEFREICQSFGWNEDVYLSQTKELPEDHRGHSQMVSKIQKLLKLSTSSNSHESELATQKANELMSKYNLEYLNDTEEKENDETYLKRVLTAKRLNAKMNALYEIIQHFYVQPVFNRSSQGETSLEVIGSKENVEVADYVIKVLDMEFERLWEVAKKSHGLKGKSAKNNYFLGLKKGYLNKLKPLEKSMSREQKALISKDLTRRVEMVYPRLRSSYTKGSKRDDHALSLGIKDSSSICLNKSVKENQSLRLLK